MEIIKGKALFETRDFANLHIMLEQCAQLYGSLPAYRFRRRPRGKVELRSYSELLADVDALMLALNELGLDQSGVAVTGPNSYEWALSYLAAINGADYVVPLDRLLPAGEMGQLLRRSKAQALIYAPQFQKLVEGLKADCPNVKYWICMDAMAEREQQRQTLEAEAQEGRHLLLSDLLKKGRLALEADEKALEAMLEAIPNQTLASLVFTSGTTSEAKGVMLSQHNLCSNIRSSSSNLRIVAGERVLSVLPLHHAFETTVGMLTILYHGGCICFTDGLRYLAQNLYEWKINVMLGVPLLFENIYKRISGSIEKSGKQNLVNIMRPIGRNLARIGVKANRQLFRAILEGLGGELRMVVSGAAAIDKEIHQAFVDFGVEFYQGYGLSESAPVVACNDSSQNVPGTIGRPLAGIELAIDNQQKGEVGELLTRSDSVMLGYYEAPELTAEVIDKDGWLHTGDLGYFEKGSLIITGRSKSVIVLTNGKNVFPEELESVLAQHQGVKGVMVFGQDNGRSAIDVAALFEVDAEALTAAGIQDIPAYLESLVTRLNQSMPAYKAVKYFLYTEEPMERTTTLKVKRFLQQEKVQQRLAASSLSLRQAQGRKLEDL